MENYEILLTKGDLPLLPPLKNSDRRQNGGDEGDYNLLDNI